MKLLSRRGPRDTEDRVAEMPNPQFSRRIKNWMIYCPETEISRLDIQERTHSPEADVPK